ncbi:ABC transporter ATP-binding protein [Priestia endophytica]|uniref:ABC transporter ATP-binding protein n=1 Tax=Priestia endophytica TaxID=135735 RepID=UPI00124E2A50|nr:ABC transporter ATP-binding protein [Priestia endophytica]KAB2488213.1 ABC transporter ATP-binding protein [Priestia endophytica]
MTPMLEIRDLSKKIGKDFVVKNINLTVNKGEILGLLGPNGAGKTTIIKMIVGLYKPYKGSIFIDGLNQKNDIEKYLNSLGAMIENPDMYKFMTGWKNLKQFSRIYQGISDKDIEEIVETVGLTKSIHKKFRTYSLGMKQRLGIAQALLHKPKLLILDEPTNGLDPNGVHELRKYLKNLCDNGMSILISSHLLSEMELMCDRVAFIKNGELLSVNSMQEISENDQKYLTTIYEFEDSQELDKAIKVLEYEYKNLEFEKGDLNKLYIHNIDRQVLFSLNKSFIINDLLIVEITHRKKTLEERFLEITNTEEMSNEKTLVTS